jgi:2-(1,2-epoxy-1,2-dihydrophenyl)acetyl-CoA isomerase
MTATDTAFSTNAGVRVERDGSVLRLTLDRPGKSNALRAEECLQLRSAVEAVDGGGEVRAVLVGATGANFCAGADLTAANDPQTKPTAGHLIRSLGAGPHGLIAALWRCPVPTVSAVHGKALGLGLHLAAACDFTLAASDAVFSEPFCKRGFSVDSGGSYLLPRLIGLRRARQMLLRGITVDASTAANWGLVDQVVAAELLEDTAAALAAELAAGPTFTLGHIKQLLNGRAPAALDEALAMEAASVETTVRSTDFKEGLRAFVERREPRFTGH